MNLYYREKKGLSEENFYKKVGEKKNVIAAILHTGVALRSVWRKNKDGGTKAEGSRLLEREGSFPVAEKEY